MFLNFAKFYRRFVRDFSQIVAFLTDLTKEAKKEIVKVKFVWFIETQKAFDELKRTFTNALVFVHFDWKSETRMKIDFFDREADEVFNQKNSDDQ